MLSLADERILVSLREMVYTVDGITYDDPEEVARRLLKKVKERAILRWGERKWELELIRAYCQLYRQKGDENVTIDRRRTQIRRVFSAYSCTLETAIALATCVGCKVQLQCIEISTEVL
jgi:hypothetical protein